ncbi:hypothetical protein K438DRAFT_1832515 [Mycena galopus ATCC 62051]|nr:hypothetical protein K438DRAFT_1832515 [Mycena galopus ATCC 62051]
MNFFPFNTDPDRPLPIWSTRNNVDWCSIGGLPLDIPPDVNDYVLKNDHNGFRIKMKQDDTADYAAYFNPHFHWLGWSPTQELRTPVVGGDEAYQDPAWVAFGNHDVETTENWVDSPTSGSEADDPGLSLARYFLKETWRSTAVKLSERILVVSQRLARGTDWYGPNLLTPSLGHIPFGVNDRALGECHESHQVANRRVRQVKAILRSQLGWLSWFTAVLFEWQQGLPVADEVFVNSLRLDERDRQVPFHYAWTSAEKETGRFRRCSPEFLSELQDITARGETSMSSLPSYSLWKDDLDRYDAFFQDTRFGKVGDVLTEFRPDWSYYLVEGVHFGARVLDFRHERRVCAERFKGVRKTSHVGKRTVTTVTFLRHNPIRVDDPPNLRRQPNPHKFQLSDFGNVASPNEGEENNLFRLDSFLARERARYRYAPRPDRSFNSYNGVANDKSTAVIHPAHSAPPSLVPGRGSIMGERGCSRVYERGPRSREPMSPTRRSGSTADQGFTLRWVSSMAAAGYAGPLRRRNSRSVRPRECRDAGRLRARSLDGCRRASPPRSSPHRRRSLSSSTRSSFSLRSTASGKSSDCDYKPINVDQTDHALLLSRDDAVQEIKSWAISSQVSEFSTPGRGSADWYWKVRWLNATMLLCKDERALLHMKAWAACLAFTDIVEVLNFAICYGVPFQLFVKQSEVQSLGLQVDMSESEAMALDAMYSPGFVESPLDYGSGGAPLYARYLSKVHELLRRPHATGFIYLGGLPSYVAQVYDTLLVDRLRLGPSHQVTNFGRGEFLLDKSEDKQEFYVTDQVSDGEVRSLCGFISRNDPALDLFLWPLPTWIEEDSLHYHGAWTRGFYAFLENLRSAIVEKKRYRWRTESQWRQYIKNGNKGTFKATEVKSEDFALGQRIMEAAFPVSWNKKRIVDIVLPELYSGSSS